MSRETTGRRGSFVEPLGSDWDAGRSVAAARSAATASAAVEEHQNDCDGAKHDKSSDHPSVTQRDHRPSPAEAIVVRVDHPLTI
jgi:hypothetical protein